MKFEYDALHCHWFERKATTARAIGVCTSERKTKWDLRSSTTHDTAQDHQSPLSIPKLVSQAHLRNVHAQSKHGAFVASVNENTNNKWSRTSRNNAHPFLVPFLFSLPSFLASLPPITDRYQSFSWFPFSRMRHGSFIS